MMDGEDGRDVSTHMARQIDENLKRAFGTADPVPDRFLQLIAKLREQETDGPGAAAGHAANAAGGPRDMAGAARR